MNHEFYKVRFKKKSHVRKFEKLSKKYRKSKLGQAILRLKFKNYFAILL